MDEQQAKADVIAFVEERGINWVQLAQYIGHAVKPKSETFTGCLLGMRTGTLVIGTGAEALTPDIASRRAPTSS